MYFETRKYDAHFSALISRTLNLDNPIWIGLRGDGDFNYNDSKKYFERC